jgi:hypothetical protein
VRGNGLRAAAYIGVADLHPQVADVMLAALAEEGVAAYASPVTSARGLLMPTQFPSGPTDRLYVDRDAQEIAWRVLDEHLPGARAELEHVQVEAAPSRSADEAGDQPAERVDDETWGQIVALFHTGDAASRWPDAENLAAEKATVDPAPAVPRAPISRQQPERDDHYHPPAPPPLPTADSTARAAWAGVIGGPLLFLLAILLDWDLASWAQLAGVAALVVGFVTLVTRMRDGSDDSDDGAVV